MDNSTSMEIMSIQATPASLSLVKMEKLALRKEPDVGRGLNNRKLGANGSGTRANEETEEGKA